MLTYPTFSTNKVPEVFDDTTAFFTRWILVTFPNTFTGDKENRKLLDELTTEEELSGFLNWALEGLRRLRANNWVFSNSKSTEKIHEEYIRKSSPIQAFLMDCTSDKPDAQVTKRDIYDAFCEYCRQQHLPIVTSDTFFKNLPKFKKIEEARPRLEGKRIRVIIGIELKPRNQWGQDEADTLDDNSPGQGGQDGQGNAEEPSECGQRVLPVHGSAHPNPAAREQLDLALQEDREEATVRLRRLGSDHFKALNEMAEYLSAFSDHEPSKNFVTDQFNLGKIRVRPDGYLEAL